MSLALNYFQGLRKCFNWAYVRQDLSDLRPPVLQRERKGFRRLILASMRWNTFIYTIEFWERAEAKRNFLRKERDWQQNDFTSKVLVVSKIWGHLLFIDYSEWHREKMYVLHGAPSPMSDFLKLACAFWGLQWSLIERNTWIKLVLPRIGPSWLLSVKEIHSPLSLPLKQDSVFLALIFQIKLQSEAWGKNGSPRTKPTEKYLGLSESVTDL